MHLPVLNSVFAVPRNEEFNIDDHSLILGTNKNWSSSDNLNVQPEFRASNSRCYVINSRLELTPRTSLYPMDSFVDYTMESCVCNCNFTLTSL